MNPLARFDNLLRYDDPQHPFVDRAAHLSLSFAGPAIMGPQWLHPRSMLATLQILEPVLKLGLYTDDDWLPVHRDTLTSRACEAVEHGGRGAFAVESRWAFDGPRVVQGCFIFRNTSDKPRELRAAWIGAARPDDQLYMLKLFPGADRSPRTPHVAAGDGAYAIRWLPEGSCDLPALGMKIEALDAGAGLEAWCGERPWHADREPANEGLHYAFILAPVMLEPGGTVEVRFAVQVAAANPGDTLPPFEPVAAGDMSESVRASEAAASPVLGDDNDALVRRARLGLWRCSLRGLNGFFGRDTASLCMADTSGFSSTFFWDSLFTSSVLAGLDPELSRGAICTLFSRQLDHDGSCQEQQWNFGVTHRRPQQSPQSPLVAWAINRHLERHDDLPFARDMYRRTWSNYRFWTNYCDADGDGLCEYRWSGQIADNSPIWDPYNRDTGGCTWLPPVASVQLNSFLYREAMELALMADDLGEADDAARLRTEAAALCERLHAVCYVAADRRFWDYNHHTQHHQRTPTFWMFWPLWARMPLDPAWVTHIIEDVLLDPKHFFGDVPFPSVAYDDPKYDSLGYWRGKAWPHVSCWLIETLDQHGYVKEADDAARRLLRAFALSGGPSENLSTDLTRPHGGHPDYNWGCAAVLHLAERLGRYHPNHPKRGVRLTH